MVFHSRGAAPSHYERDDALLSAAQRHEALHFLASVPRPAWMPQPPLAAMLPDAPRPSQPRATLASAAITQEGNRWASFVSEYATRLKQLDRSARAAGFEETLLIDRREAILDDPLFQRFGGTALAQRLKRGRPFCDAFKPVALWRALMRSREGDYVMCADTSRLQPTRLQPHVHRLLPHAVQVGGRLTLLEHSQPQQQRARRGPHAAPNPNPNPNPKPKPKPKPNP